MTWVQLVAVPTRGCLQVDVLRAGAYVDPHQTWMSVVAKVACVSNPQPRLVVPRDPPHFSLLPTILTTSLVRVLADDDKLRGPRS